MTQGAPETADVQPIWVAALPAGQRPPAAELAEGGDLVDKEWSQQEPVELVQPHAQCVHCNRQSASTHTDVGVGW